MKKIYLLIFFICQLCIPLVAQQWISSNVLDGISGNVLFTRMTAGDLQNNYVCGTFAGDVKFKGVNIPNAGGTDIFIAKYDDDQNEIWIKTIGGTGAEANPLITISNDNNIIVAGTFSGTCYFDGNELTAMGGRDVFLAKYDRNTGDIIWVKHIGKSSGNPTPQSLVIDSNNDILVGISSSTTNETEIEDNVVIPAYSSGVVKFDQNGDYQDWIIIFKHTSGYHSITGILELDNMYYVTGLSGNKVEFTDNGNNTFSDGSTDGSAYFFLLKIRNNGTFDNTDCWFKFASNTNVSGSSSCQFINADNHGNICIEGTYNATTFSFDGNNLNLPVKGQQDLFLITLDKSGQILDFTSIASDKNEVIYGTKVISDILYITGTTYGKLYFNKDSIDGSSSNAMFVAAYQVDSDGTIGVIGAVEGVEGALRAVDLIVTTNYYNLIGNHRYTSGSLTIGDSIYYGSGTRSNSFIAKACPIIHLDTLDFKHVSGCDALAKNGETKINVRGGVTPSSYILMKDGFGEVANQASNHFTKLDTGKYTATVLYNDGYCSKNLPFTVKAPKSLSFKSVTLPELPCSSSAAGDIEISINNPTGAELEYYARAILPSQGGTQVYFKDWRDGQVDTALFVNCPLGQYFLRVRFKEGAACDTVYKTSISPKETGTISASTEDYTCNPANVTPSGSQGRITVTVDDAQKGEWFALIDVASGATVQTKSVETPGRTSYTFEGRIPAGTYATLAGESGALCMLSDTVTIEQPDPIVVQSVKASGALCYGEATGKITIAATGNGTSLDYELFIKNDDDSYTSVKNGDFSDRIQISGLLAGTYKLELTDNVNGIQTCAYTYPSEIVVPNVGVEFGLAVADSSSLCYGTTNSGYIHFNLTGGTSGRYTYTLTGGNNPPQNINGRFNNLPAGTYQAKVMEQANGCVYDYPEPIKLIRFPEILTGSVIPKDVLCNGGSTGEISIASVSGGSGDYTVIATNTVSSVTHAATGTNPYKMEGLVKGTYAISIKDDVTKCTPSPLSNVVIGEPDVLEFDTRTKEDIKCYGDLTGKVIVAAKGGKADAQNPYQYTLTYGSVSHTQASGTFDGLAPGFYSVTVEDNNQCTANSGALEVTQPAVIEIKTVTPTNVVCFDESNGSINVVEVTGGTTLLSTYKYTLSNMDGTGPIDNGTSPIFAGLKAKSYKLSVRDDHNCLKEMSPIVINQPEKLLVSGDLKIKPESCKAPDGTIQVTVTGGTAPYSFSSGGSYSEAQYASIYKFSGLIADQYTINVKDKNGCMIDPKNVNVEKNSLTAGAIATEIKCFKDKSMLIVNASSSHAADMKSFSLYKGGTLFKEETSAVFNDLDAGSYYVAVVDTNGCTVTTPTVLITKPDQIEISVDMKSASGQTVADGALTVKVSGGTPFDGYKYKFVLKSKGELVADILTTSPNTFDNLLPAEYGIEIWDKNDCSLGTVDEVDIKTGIRNKDANELKIYPNPSDGRFYVQWNQEKDMSLNVEIFNMAGKLVYKNVVPVGAGTAETLVDISGQPKGTYIMRVRELNVQQKLVIQ